MHHYTSSSGQGSKGQELKCFRGTGLDTINNCYTVSEHLQGYYCLSFSDCHPLLCWSWFNITLLRNLSRSSLKYSLSLLLTVISLIALCIYVLTVSFL